MTLKNKKNMVVSKCKLRSLIADQFLKYGNSQHAKNINEKLKNHSEHDKDAIKINKQQAINRDYLKVLLIKVLL